METICAISTPLGISGIGIIRLSGEKTYKIIEEIFLPKRKTKVKNWPTHTVHYGYIVDGERIIDEVLVTIMRAPKSYTREDMAEIGCHGGLSALKEVLNLCIKKGAKLASPGEFTKRAFLNGRIDLSQAESVLEIINSQTEKSLEISIKKLKGSLSNEINKLYEKIFSLLVQIEGKIDFPEEEDISEINLNVEEEIKKIKTQIKEILSKSKNGKIVFEGIKAAIIGRTNVGKSSLLNKLLKEERAIVTEIPGTTRDILQETINIKGIPVKIIDTAGIRKTKGKIEKMGVKKALYWMEKAEINLLVLDGSQALNQNDRKLLQKIKNKTYLIVINKIDLPMKINKEELKNFPEENISYISAKTGYGIEKLEEKIYNLILKGYGNIKETEFYLNIRQENLLKKSYSIIKNTLKLCKEKQGIELIAQNLREIIKMIDSITGKNISQHILEEIFSQFCIGK